MWAPDSVTIGAVLGAEASQDQREVAAHRVQVQDRGGLLLRFLLTPTHEAGRLHVELQQTFMRANEIRIEGHSMLEFALQATSEHWLSQFVRLACLASQRIGEIEMMQRVSVVRLDGLSNQSTASADLPSARYSHPMQ
jgi:hypothetical protein